jgi:5-methyltetrahydrofolate--homocysteine methyltransferase
VNSDLAGQGQRFVIIGENIHTTRVLPRAGRHVVEGPGGDVAVRFTARDGQIRHLRVPDKFKAQQAYQEGRVKHVAIAVRAAMADVEPDASDGKEYLAVLAARQIAHGARFLDVNVDEISVRPGEQIESMRWLVEFIEPLSSVPLSIDSSNLQVIEAGIRTCRALAGAPLLNSASLERSEALDFAAAHLLPVVVTAAGESGMPQDAEQRVANASRMIEAAFAKSVPAERLYVDALVFPISVDSGFGTHYLDAVRIIREKYGDRIHVTGGLSNVSFGLPCRRLINDVFINLAIDAGADSGIVDAVANDLNKVLRADRNARPYQLARDMLLGVDRNCRTFLRAYRQGELAMAQA